MEQQVQEEISDMQIAGSVIIITGAANGLGKCFAQTLMARGAKVCVADIDVEAGTKTKEELAAEHGSDRVIFMKCDVTDDACFKGVWDTTQEQLGPVTMLINNAGIGNEKNWKLTLDVNVGGCMRGTFLALDRMGVNKGGAGGIVVNMASIAGLKVVPFGPTYSATKHAIVGLSRSLGHAFHYKISKVKVQCLCPSFVKTDLIVNSKDTAFSPECAAVLEKFAGSVSYMSPETVADALVKLLEEGKNGGCLVVEAEKDAYYVDPPLAS